MLSHRAPFWLPEGHLQTIVPALWGRRVMRTGNPLQRTRWTTPDGDFIDLDWHEASGVHSASRPLLVLFHGLEGSSASHYARTFSQWALQNQVGFVVPHFRGCSGEANLTPRAYHSGDTPEIDWVLRRLKAENPHRSLLAVGISLGGNALARWAGEQGLAAANVVDALASVCSPLDLTASGHAIGRGINRWLYTPMFLNTLIPKAIQKAKQFPGLVDVKRLQQAKNLYEFDDVFTAPVHGYANADDYWARASAKPVLSDVRVRMLLLNAMNDPFVPVSSLPSHQEVSPSVTLWRPAQGGHVGFPGRSGPRGHWLMPMPEGVGAWLVEGVNRLP